jgi:phenylacetate-CoA ligase
MVKLRGVNLFPEAIGSIVSEDGRSNGEYVCILDGTESGREDMTVLVETRDASIVKDALEAELSQRFKEALGVKLLVKAVDRGGVDH